MREYFIGCLALGGVWAVLMFGFSLMAAWSL